MKVIRGIIGFFAIVSLVFSTPGCTSKSADDLAVQTVAKADGIVKPPQAFIDLLFAEQTIKEVNKISSIKSPDPSSVWGKFKIAEKLQSQNKIELAKQVLMEIVSDTSSESRTVLWAWNGLRALGEKPKRTQVFGLVLEVPQKNETEYLAMYSDLRARYINYTGHIDVWEASDNEMDKFLNRITAQSQNIVDKSMPTRGRQKMKTNKVRFSFLTSNGIYQSEETLDNLSQGNTDLGELFLTSTEVLQRLVEQSESVN